LLTRYIIDDFVERPTSVLRCILWIPWFYHRESPTFYILRVHHDARKQKLVGLPDKRVRGFYIPEWESFYVLPFVSALQLELELYLASFHHSRQ